MCVLLFEVIFMWLINIKAFSAIIQILLFAYWLQNHTSGNSMNRLDLYNFIQSMNGGKNDHKNTSTH